MKNLTNALMAQAPLSALVLMCVVGTALAEDGPPRCEKKTEALLEGRCVHKTRCPAGLTPDGSACAPVPTCDEGTHGVKPRRAGVEAAREGGLSLVVPQTPICDLCPGKWWLISLPNAFSERSCD